MVHTPECFSLLLLHLSTMSNNVSVRPSWIFYCSKHFQMSKITIKLVECQRLLCAVCSVWYCVKLVKWSNKLEKVFYLHLNISVCDGGPGEWFRFNCCRFWWKSVLIYWNKYCQDTETDRNRLNGKTKMTSMRVSMEITNLIETTEILEINGSW